MVKKEEKEFNRQAYFDAFYSVFTPDAQRKVAKKLLDKALKGDKSLLQYVHDRLLGRPAESMDITTGGNAINVQLFIPEKNVKEE